MRSPRFGLVVVVVIVVAVAGGCRPPGYGHHGDDQGDVDAGPAADGPASDGADAVPADAAGPAPDAAACTAGFTLAGHAAATTVWLTGDFVAWGGTLDAGAIEMTRGADDIWRVNHGFAPGMYQYKYIVDGTMWIPDPGNADTVPDGFGGVNSVFTCP